LAGEANLPPIGGNDINELGKSLHEIVEKVPEHIRRHFHAPELNYFKLPDKLREYIWSGKIEKSTRPAIKINKSIRATEEPIRQDETDDEVDPTDQVESALHRYNDIRIGRQVLRAIAMLGKNPQAGKATMFLRQEWRFETIELVKSASKQHQVKGQPEPEYEVKISKTGSLLDAVNGSDARIRICEKCGKFFWAVRTDRRGCTSACRNAIRQRNKRKRDKKQRNGNTD
jgi:hypothetical protein